MTYGLNVTNTSGNVILDTSLPQMPLVASGTASSTGISLSNNQAFVAFSSLTVPVVYVRPQSTGSYILIGNITNTGFYYKSDSNIDWRVYDGTGNGWSSSSNYGMNVYDSSGTLIYNTNKNPPFIRLIEEAIPSSFTPSITNGTTISTFSFSFSAYDGGLPFVSASTLQSCSILAGPAIYLSLCCGANYTSSSSITFAIWEYEMAGNNPIGSSTYKTGQEPRSFLMIK